MPTKPTMKTNLRTRLQVEGLTEGIGYRIIEIDNPAFVQSGKADQEPPKVGETFYIEYQFKADDLYFGYENLLLFIGRQTPWEGIHNYTRYFKSVEELAAVLRGVKVELDKDMAREQLKKLERKAEKLRKDYEL